MVSGFRSKDIKPASNLRVRTGHFWFVYIFSEERVGGDGGGHDVRSQGPSVTTSFSSYSMIDHIHPLPAYNELFYQPCLWYATRQGILFTSAGRVWRA
jgi:hypothetical protein